jgi:hypothetical protein
MDINMHTWRMQLRLRWTFYFGFNQIFIPINLVLIAIKNIIKGEIWNLNYKAN